MPAPVYTTVTALKRAGLDLPAAWSPSDRNEMIRTVSAWIDDYTAQTFCPLAETVWVDGDSDPVVYHPRFLPILQLNSIVVDPNRVTQRGYIFDSGLPDVLFPRKTYRDLDPLLPSYNFPVGTYLLQPADNPRYVESVRRNFPGGAGNIALDGVFGWLDPASRKTIATTLAGTCAIDAESLSLTDITGLRPRDVLLLGDVFAIAQEITPGAGVTGSVKVDKLEGLLVSELPSGTGVRSWGAVPRRIDEVCKYLIMKQVREYQLWAQGKLVDFDRIRGEKTDHYQYEMWAPYQLIGLKGMAGTTGHPIHDQTLSDYTQPTIPHFA